MIDVIVCIYSCNWCGVVEQNFDVPIRLVDQEVVDWVQNTIGRALAADHGRRSPKCSATEFQNLKIPVPSGTPTIGRPVEH